jgi:hypothetical protein
MKKGYFRARIVNQDIKKMWPYYTGIFLGGAIGQFFRLIGHLYNGRYSQIIEILL